MIRFEGLPFLTTLLLVTMLGASPTRSGTLELEPCEIQGLERAARCGRLEVPESPSEPNGRTIGLAITVLSADSDEPAPDPVFYLAGGPGDAASRSAGFVDQAFAEILRDRNVVFVDQRGTGGSNPLRCPIYGDGKTLAGYFDVTMFPVGAIATCRRELERTADLTQYTTLAAVRDLEAVRTALGYERINLYGTSYGTRVGLTYMRLHPEALRAVVLKGVAPPEITFPVHYAVDAQRALDGLFADCAADEGCSAAFPDPAGELASLLARLEEEPAEVELAHPQTGEVETVRLSAEAVATTMLGMLQSPGMASQLPRMIHEAHNGDPSALANVVLRYRFGSSQVIHVGMHLSVGCPEDIRRFDEATARRLGQGSFLGTYRSLGQAGACSVWVEGLADAADLAPAVADTPVLMLSGEFDPVTPPRWAELAARDLPNARQVVLRRGGHNFEGGMGCLDRLMAEFIDRGSAEGLDDSCAAQGRRPPFALPE